MLADHPGAGRPALAGENVVWSDSEYSRGNELWAAAPDGRKWRILALPPTVEGRSVWLGDLAASDRRVAVIVAGVQRSPDGTGPEAVWISGQDGFGPLEAPSYFERGCRQIAADVDADRVAFLEINCDGRGAAVVKEVGSGETVARLPAAPVPMGNKSQIRLAGRYLAWDEWRPWMSGSPHWIVVYDLVLAREAYRTDVLPLLPSGRPYGHYLQYDLGADGTLVLKAGRSSEPPSVFAWLSPASPEPHSIPVATSSAGPAIAGDLVAVQRREPRDYAVIDLAGREVNVFERQRVNGGGDIAFDGSRLAWTGLESLGRASMWSLVTSLFPVPTSRLVPPVIDEFAIRPSRFAVARRSLARVGARRGAVIRYSVSRPGRVVLLVERVLAGRRAAGHCRKPTRRLRRRPRCNRYVRVGAVAQGDRAGRVADRFGGVVRGRPLRPGRYRATLTARGLAGRTPKPRRARFVILRR